MKIEKDLFLETLILRIRGETIKFASREKKKNSKIEDELIKDIETLERQNPEHTPNLNFSTG